MFLSLESSILEIPVFMTFMILVPFKSGEKSDLVLNWNPTRLGF